MSEIINLNKFKKDKAKKQKEAEANNNRILFGTPKNIKAAAKKINLIEQKRLEKLKLETKDKDDK